jgi:TM2 domain-containing membrane protein YozV
MLSLVAPGLGQIYVGEGRRGAMVLVGAIIVANLNVIILPLIAMANPTISSVTPGARSIWAYWIPRVVHDVASFWSVVFWVWAIVDAVIVTRKKNQGR